MKKFKNWFFQPQIFLIFSLIIGIMLVFLTPIGAGFDEDTHIARIWEISRLKFIPNSLLGQGPEFPQVFYKFLIVKMKLSAQLVLISIKQYRFENRLG
jgi:hypothetical protein